MPHPKLLRKYFGYSVLALREIKSVTKISQQHYHIHLSQITINASLLLTVPKAQTPFAKRHNLLFRRNGAYMYFTYTKECQLLKNNQFISKT